MLTVAFVMLAEVFIFVPSIARFREDFLMARLERAQIASLAVLAAENIIDQQIEQELLDNAGVYNVILRRDEMSQLVLSSPIPQELGRTYDLRDTTPWILIMDALHVMVTPENELIRVRGTPLRNAGDLIEVTMDTTPLRVANPLAHFTGTQLGPEIRACARDSETLIEQGMHLAPSGARRAQVAPGERRPQSR